PVRTPVQTPVQTPAEPVRPASPFRASGDASTLVVATGIGFPPMFETRGEPKGYDIDLARALAPRLGKQDVRFVGASGLRERVARGEADLGIGAISVTPDRERETLFSLPYLTPQVVAFVPTGATAPLESLASRRCYVAHEVYKKQAAAAGCEVLGVKEANAALVESREGKADVLVMDTLEALLHRDAWEPTPIVLSTDRYAIALQLGNDELKSSVDRALGDMIADGTLAALNARYGFDTIVAAGGSIR
ncbi:MAG: amino acid ABC transporter substrate-binding protein, partial [Deltaproteobacteria bacterium]|nr:amino acid ABC transporter substrate-binding protein [Deltaproteobacteria bacterium]